MIFKMKKERLAGFATVVLLFCSVLVYVLPAPLDKAVSAAALSRTVVIDAGHGGEDGGAVGVDGTLEKDINLLVATNLADMLTAAGFEVHMTRTEDVSLAADGNSVKERKRADLKERVRIMDAHPDAIFVSIHMNKYPDAGVWGAQTFYAPGSETGERLASHIQNALKMLQPENKRVHKEGDKNIYILRHTKTSGVIVECGFISNSQELKNLCDESYRVRVAECIAAGIQAFYENNQPAA